jgi:hypothetical protein
MMICEFCRKYDPKSGCELGLKIPQRMACREFEPGIERFCSNPKDFVSTQQIIGMATHFGFKGVELKKIKLMTAREETKVVDARP